MTDGTHRIPGGRSLALLLAAALLSAPVSRAAAYGEGTEEFEQIVKAPDPGGGENDWGADAISLFGCLLGNLLGTLLCAGFARIGVPSDRRMMPTALLPTEEKRMMALSCSVMP